MRLYTIEAVAEVGVVVVDYMMSRVWGFVWLR